MRFDTSAHLAVACSKPATNSPFANNDAADLARALREFLHVCYSTGLSLPEAVVFPADAKARVHSYVMERYQGLAVDGYRLKVGRDDTLTINGVELRFAEPAEEANAGS